MRRLVVSIGLILAAIGATALYLHHNTPPACTSEPALDRVSAALHDDFHLESVFLNDIRTVSGGAFSSRYDCTAEVTTIRGNQDLSDLSWRSLRYTIVRQNSPTGYSVTTELGGSTPFVREKSTFWQRLWFDR